MNSKKIFADLARRYPTPLKVQGFLKTLKYNREEKSETVRSAAETLRKKKAHCLEASILAAAILEQKGYPPLILNLDSMDHLCHAIFVYKTKTGWGSVAKSREHGLHGRKPRFRSLRDLAWSYFDPFIDKTGKITGYSLLHLDESKTDWRFAKSNLWKLEQFIVNSKHTPLKSSKKRYHQVHREYLKNGHTTQTGRHWL